MAKEKRDERILRPALRQEKLAESIIAAATLGFSGDVLTEELEFEPIASTGPATGTEIVEVSEWDREKGGGAEDKP